MEKPLPHGGSLALSFQRESFALGRPNCESSMSSDGKGCEPAVDDGAVKGVAAMLGGYVGRYLKEESFRNTIREKWESCVARKMGDSFDDRVLEDLEKGIEGVEDLVRQRESMSREETMNSLKHCVWLLKAVASSNPDISQRNGMVTGIGPSSYLSACARFYLSVARKIEGRNSSSVQHLLQVFFETPFLARTVFLPDLWEHLFLPHLLHIRIWHNNEVESISSSGTSGEHIKLKSLSKLYNERIDLGTAHFAAYYMQRLRVEARPVPKVALHLMGSHGELSRRKSLEHRRASIGSVQRRKSMDSCTSNLTVNKNQRGEQDLLNVLREKGITRSGSHAAGNGRIECSKADNYLSDDVRRAISTICWSDFLEECEAAVRTVTRAWLGSHGNHVIGYLASEPPFIGGVLEILFASNDDEVLELALSFLAEIVVSNEANGHMILELDPQLDVFTRLLRRKSVFLKAAALLYLLKPQAKQMVSTEWVPLILRVLEFGDQTQVLFKFRCVPRIAAFYFLKELLLGFDEDKRSENVRELVSLGGLGMLMKRFEPGTDFDERKDIAKIVLCCIKADGMCRNYIAEHISRASLLELLVRELHNSTSVALRLLIELLCLNRRSKINELLSEMRIGWAGISTIHALLIYLQKSSSEELPVVAAVLLLFDLYLQDESSECSLYREEAVDAIMASLGSGSCSPELQEQSARCLHILGGRFSINGETTIEHWLLEQSGIWDGVDSTVNGGDAVIETDKLLKKEEEKTRQWQSKTASALLNFGHEKFLLSLSISMENKIPVLSRACLVTLSWLSGFLHMADEKTLQMEVCSIFFPQLLMSLKFDRDLEERVLATVALLNLVKNTGCFSMLYPLNEDTTKLLRNLSLVTWAAEELLSMGSISSGKQ
ncbi:hypothetical protein MLD38_038589 [Melastoma candidum]|uniref:Uncharacterized protein n=1 Tax=Melastoma candidum TaxID=119954 RepID=A0ACB9L0N0_9MYRT|nr:hypothetical protein MLD38_038589 [Melastoma candidum]